MQTEQKDNTIVKRPRGRPRVLTDEERKEHRQKTLRVRFKDEEEWRAHRNKISRDHYNKHKDDPEWYNNKVEKMAVHQTPERYHETKEYLRRRYYMNKYGNLDKYKPKPFTNS